MTDDDLRNDILNKVLSRLSTESSRRDEAVGAVIGLSAPELDQAALNELAALVPELPHSLYEKWAGMFADRILETVPREQVEELCRDNDESRGALLLVYVMFMESARMEKVVAKDLERLGGSQSSKNDNASLLAAWLRARMGGQTRTQ